MSGNEKLKALFARARVDTAFRAQLAATTGYSRLVFGWMAFLFAALAVATSLFLGLREGVWFPGTAGVCAVSAVVNLLLHGKMGERLAILESMGEAPGTTAEPDPSHGMGPVGRVPGP